MTFRGITGMIQDEGVKNGISVMYKYMTNKKIRYRMQKIDRFFRKYSDYVGYGIYIGIN